MIIYFVIKSEARSYVRTLRKGVEINYHTILASDRSQQISNKTEWFEKKIFLNVWSVLVNISQMAVNKEKKYY
jgi:hypothetical protein